MKFLKKTNENKEIKKIAVIKKKEILLILLASFLLIVGFVSYKPNTNNDYGKIADVQNYSESQIGETTLVSSNAVNETNNEINNETKNENNVEETKEEYFLKEKMERDKTYSESLETYENILESSNITNDQKAIAQNEITNITNEKKTIQIAENLIKMKGFKDVIILKNGTGISVIVKSDVLLPEQVAQIQNIVEREFKTQSKNINITNK